PNDPPRSPRSTLRNGFPFAAVLVVSFFTTSSAANTRPFAFSSAFSSATVRVGTGSGMALSKARHLAHRNPQKIPSPPLVCPPHSSLSQNQRGNLKATHHPTP